MRIIKNVKISIRKDGTVIVDTIGYKGDDCLHIVKEIERLVDGRVVDSKFNTEYYEVESL